MTTHELLVEWKSRFASHKSMTASRAFASFRTDEPHLLAARTTFLRHMDAPTFKAFEVDRLYSRKSVFAAFDDAITETAP